MNFKQRYPEEKEVVEFVDSFADRFLKLPLELFIIKASAEDYIALHQAYIHTCDKRKQKTLYNDTEQFIQTMNTFSEEMRKYGRELFKLIELADKYNFPYPY